MKTKNPQITVLTLISFLTASVAFAQTPAAGTATGAAQGAANSTAPAIQTTPPATSLNANAAQAAANNTAAQTAAASNANRATTPAVNTPAAANPNLNPNLGAQGSLNTGVQTNGTINTPGNLNTSPTNVPVANGRAGDVANPNSAVNPDSRIRTGSEAAGAVDSSLAGSAVIQGDVNTNKNMNRDAAANATANGQLNALATGSESTGVINVLAPGDIARDIRASSETSRDAVYAKVNAKLDTGDRVLSDINRQARELRGDARTQFKAAADSVRDSEKALKRSLSDARKGTNENWSEVQTRLASDYEAYAAAVARAHAAATVVGGTTAPTP